jgi:hypothetical protein
MGVIAFVLVLFAGAMAFQGRWLAFGFHAAGALAWAFVADLKLRSRR